MSYPIPDPLEKTIKVPFRKKNGNLVFLYDEKIDLLSAMKDNIIGDIILPVFGYENTELISAFNYERQVELFKKDESLFARLAITNPSLTENEKKIINQDTDYVKTKNSGFSFDGSSFVRIELNENLVMKYRGTKNSQLYPAKVDIPILNQEAKSLNHAYSLLSQKFQTHRTAHTGNVFKNFFYLDKDFNNIRDLDRLRQFKEAEINQEIYQSKSQIDRIA